MFIFYFLTNFSYLGCLIPIFHLQFPENKYVKCIFHTDILMIYTPQRYASKNIEYLPFRKVNILICNKRKGLEKVKM